MPRFVERIYVWIIRPADNPKDGGTEPGYAPYRPFGPGPREEFCPRFDTRNRMAS